MSKASSNIIYRLHQIGERTGEWPLAVATDTVVYASDNPDLVTAWPGDPAAPGDLVLLHTRTIGETDLLRRDGKWFLYATVEAPAEDAGLVFVAGHPVRDVRGFGDVPAS